jgi:hypothetical protein
VRNAVFAVIVCASVSCRPHAGSQAERGDDVRGVPEAGGSASPRGTTPPGPLDSAARRPPKAKAKCRAATVVGGVGAVPLARGDVSGPNLDVVNDAGIGAMGEVPNDVWLDLAPGARMVARDPVSTRETSFTGPALARACVDYAEESWIVRGVFESVPGAGERPGGEEWIVTPHATIRYDAAGMRVVVSSTTTDIDVAKGTAFVWVAPETSLRVAMEAGAPAHPPSADGWVRLDGGLHAVARPDKPAAPDAAASVALAGCTLAAKEAHDLADRIAAADANLGDLAAKHVAARRVARAVCRGALLRVEALPPSVTRDADLTAARAADTSWRAISDGHAGGP